MSGGSWDYLSFKVSDASRALLEDKCSDRPWGELDLNEDQKQWRQRLGRHLALVADALHAIEWVDSCDSSYPDDVKAIQKFSNETAFLEIARSLISVKTEDDE